MLVRPGERIPVDGMVAEGCSDLDKSFLTGESRPVTVRPNEVVAAGEMNLTGRLDIRVSAAGEETSLRKIANLVALAEQARSKYASLASKAASILRSDDSLGRRGCFHRLVHRHRGCSDRPQYSNRAVDHHVPLRAGTGCSCRFDSGERETVSRKSSLEKARPGLNDSLRSTRSYSTRPVP